MTPVVGVVIPLVFTLLAAIGLGVGVPRPFSKVKAIWEAILVAFLVVTFCTVYFYNVTLGAFERSSQYRHMPNLLGDAWSKTDESMRASLYGLRLRARQAGIPPADFEPIVQHVIMPIIVDDKPDKLDRIQKAVTTVESALTPPSVAPTSSPQP